MKERHWWRRTGKNSSSNSLFRLLPPFCRCENSGSVFPLDIREYCSSPLLSVLLPMHPGFPSYQQMWRCTTHISHRPARLAAWTSNEINSAVCAEVGQYPARTIPNTSPWLPRILWVGNLHLGFVKTCRNFPAQNRRICPAQNRRGAASSSFRISLMSLNHTFCPETCLCASRRNQETSVAPHFWAEPVYSDAFHL